MKQEFYSTNNLEEKVGFETALLNGMASNFGLYMIAREDIPKISLNTIQKMKDMAYHEIAFEVLNPYIGQVIEENSLRSMLKDAYDPSKIPTEVQHVTGKTHIMWLTKGPTYSFKDYAARFFARSLNHLLSKKGLQRTVVVATSGDTGGAVADALHGLSNVNNIVFYPKGSISIPQRRQMTTLQDNVYAFEVDGDFDVCQALAKNILADKKFAEQVFGDSERITSANSISIGRLLPQAVYPFYAYSRIMNDGEKMIASIPSGNFGDMMGTVLAKEMGLPISKIICGVNENTEFPEFLQTGRYTVKPSVKSPSSAMIVSHPSNLARLIDFYRGHMHDERDPITKKVKMMGVIDKMPNIEEMRKDIFSTGVNNQTHYTTMKEVYDRYGVILDPHGAVGWKTLELFLLGKHDKLSVIYETADPGKCPDDVEKAIGIIPPLPPGMKKQERLAERIYKIENPSEQTKNGLKLTEKQIKEAKEKIKEIFL
jgi:threonine synthase